MAYLNERLQSVQQRGRTPIPAPFLRAFSEKRTRALFPVTLQFSRRLRAAVATITGSIQKVEIIWNGVAVTQVPAGDPFNVKLYYSAHNPAGGQWDICGTVISTDGSLSQYQIEGTSILGGTDLVSTSGMLIQTPGALVMPSSAVTLRVTLWGIPEFNSTPPDKSLW